MNAEISETLLHHNPLLFGCGDHSYITREVDVLCFIYFKKVNRNNHLQSVIKNFLNGPFGGGGGVLQDGRGTLNRVKIELDMLVYCEWTTGWLGPQR